MNVKISNIKYQISNIKNIANNLYPPPYRSMLLVAATNMCYKYVLPVCATCYLVYAMRHILIVVFRACIPALSTLSSGGSADPVYVLGSLVWRVELDYPVHRRDVQTSGGDVRA